MANDLTVLGLFLVEHDNESACKLCVLASRPAHLSPLACMLTRFLGLQE